MSSCSTACPGSKAICVRPSIRPWVIQSEYLRKRQVRRRLPNSHVDTSASWIGSSPLFTSLYLVEWSGFGVDPK